MSSNSKPNLKAGSTFGESFDQSVHKTYDFASDDASSVDGDSNEVDDMEEARGVAEKETQRLRFWRFVVTDVLIFVGVTLSLTGYAILRDMQDREFQKAFETFAETLRDSTAERQQVSEQALASLANSASVMTGTENMNPWPYRTPLKFESSAEQVRALTSSRIRSVSFNSVVQQVNKDLWLKYVDNVHEQVVEENHRIAGTQDSDFDPIGYQSQITMFDAENKVYLPDTLRDYYFPSLTWSPPPPSYETINWNLGSVPEFENVLETFLQSELPKGDTLLSPIVSRSKVPLTAGVKEYQDEQPLTYVFAPVHDQNITSPQIQTSFVAVVAGGFAWQDQLRNTLPSNVKGIVVVVQSKGEYCNNGEDAASSFSYQVNGPEVLALGPGDRHDEEYEQYRVTMPLPASSAASRMEHYQYELVSKLSLSFDFDFAYCF